jgi:uncharacterized protein (TIGR02466 family)
MLFGVPVAIFKNCDIGMHNMAASSRSLTEELGKFIVKSVGDFATSVGVVGDFEITKWWVVDMKFGMQNHLHVHPDSDASCVYYLDVSDDAVPLSLVDQRPSSIFTNHSGKKSNGEVVGGYKSINIKPASGELVVFPSYVPHFVSTKLDNKRRVCLAANLKIRS